jgi:hypothetical protein
LQDFEMYKLYVVLDKNMKCMCDISEQHSLNSKK